MEGLIGTESYLCISDLQIPFEAPRSLEFVTYLKRHFKVPDENCYNVGDEIDCYFGSLYKKHPDQIHSAKTELQVAKETLKEWYARFPKMRLAISNHGLRWLRRAIEAEIPSELLRKYEEIIEAPDGWIWKDEWRIEASKQPFRMIHGMGYSGARGHVNAAIDGQMSTVIGHLHSHAGINYLKFMGGQQIWAANAGCLIDESALAFHYGKDNRQKPVLGSLVVVNGGTTPMFIPYET